MTVVAGTGATALITGVAGQDGHYLARLLQEDGLTVHGLHRPGGSATGAARVPGVQYRGVDLTDADAVHAAVRDTAPDYVFHLAAVSSVAVSWADPVGTTAVNALSTAAVAEACLREQDRRGTAIALVNASSCEIFAGADRSPQDEDSPVRPLSPYGAAKAFGHAMCQSYRARGLAASNAILYPHESPRRPARFVTRKIVAAVAAIAHGGAEPLPLGDLATRRDWGWAPDYADAMYRMATRTGDGAGDPVGDDYVVATGEGHTVAEFAAAAFAVAGIEDWRAYVRTDPALIRPREGAAVIGDPAKAAALLGWRPTLRFDDVVKAMTAHELGTTHELDTSHEPGQEQER